MKKIQLSIIILIAVFALSSCKKVGPEQELSTVYRMVSTVAGSSGSGSLGGYAEGTGSQASFNFVYGMVMDAVGNIYLADQTNHRIRKITPAGVVSTFAGDGQNGYLDGAATVAQFSYPSGIVMDAAGNLYVSEYNHVIRKITPAGIVSTYAGNGQRGFADGPAATAEFNNPTGLAIDKAGNLYVSDTYNKLIRKITPVGIVSTYAGTFDTGSSFGYPYTGAAAGLRFGTAGPSGITVDPSGNVYVVDWYIQFIYKITPDRMVTTIGTSHGDRGQEGAAAIYRDGSITTARFNFPQGIAADATGNVYVADQYNNRIRKIGADGIVSTLAGNGTLSDVDGLSTEASFFQPFCLTTDANGNVYVGEVNMVRKIETITDITKMKNSWNNPQSWGNPR